MISLQTQIRWKRLRYEVVSFLSQFLKVERNTTKNIREKNRFLLLSLYWVIGLGFYAAYISTVEIFNGPDVKMAFIF
jgi:hypothetical protein